MPNDEKISSGEAIHILGVTYRTLYRLADKGELGCEWLATSNGKQRIFRRREVEQLAQQRAVQ